MLTCCLTHCASLEDDQPQRRQFRLRECAQRAAARGKQAAGCGVREGAYVLESERVRECVFLGGGAARHTTGFGTREERREKREETDCALQICLMPRGKAKPVSPTHTLSLSHTHTLSLTHSLTHTGCQPCARKQDTHRRRRRHRQRHAVCSTVAVPIYL